MQNNKDIKVLIIDDEAAVRLSYADYLEDCEYSVYTADNGKSGLEIFANEEVDIVLVDLRMPEVDGLEVLAEVQKQNKFIPTIVISGTGAISEAIEAVQKGAWDFLLKPITDFSILTHSIEKVLEKAKLKRENLEYQKNLEIIVNQRTTELKVAYDELRTINKRLQNIVTSTRKLSVLNDLNDLCQKLLQEICKQLNASGGSLYLKDKDGLRLKYSLDSGHAVEFIKVPIDARTVFGRVSLAKECLLIEDINEDHSIKRSGWDHYYNGSVVAFPLLDENKEIDGIVTIHNPEITPFTQQDKEIGLILSSYSLEAIRAAKVTDELRKSEEQYHQAQKMESIGRLAGGVAHDLNNLLTPILGYGEILLDDFSQNDTRRESVEEILNAGLRAKDLIRQLLAFSRKQTLEYKSINLNETLMGFEKLLRRTIREDIKINIDMTNEIKPVLADIGQIEQVIMNLSVNASDAMPEGGTLTFKTETVNLEPEHLSENENFVAGEYVQLTVSDNGSGMNEKTIENLFEPFFSTKGEKGTGLGLSTVYGIIKQHGGFINVSSELSVGSTFNIFLPSSEDRIIRNRTGRAEDYKPVGSETILIVEDNNQVRHISHSILQRQGYFVLSASDGNQALSLIDSFNGDIDLLLSDMVMPGINGKELYEILRDKYPEMKAIFMSGYTEDLMIYEEALENNIEFIQKPFTFQSFSAKVREVLESDQANQ